MLGNTTTRWGAVARAFHAIGALLIVALIVHGWWMTEFPPREQRLAQYAWHASIGYALLALTVGRLLWRWTQPVPAPPADARAWERLAAHAGHAGLYGLMLVAAVTGWGLAGTFRAPLDARLFGVIPVPALVGNENPALHEQLETLHVVLSWSLAALVVLHVAAAVYHQTVKRDGILFRMFGR